MDAWYVSILTTFLWGMAFFILNMILHKKLPKTATEKELLELLSSKDPFEDVLESNFIRLTLRKQNSEEG